MHDFALGIDGFRYADLYRPERLRALCEHFDSWLGEADAALHEQYLAFRRTGGEGLAPEALSDLLVRTAPHVAAFLARLFHVEAERDRAMADTQRRLEAIFTYKHAVVDRLAKRFKGVDPAGWDVDKLASDVELLMRSAFPESHEEAEDECAMGLMASRLIGLRDRLRGGDAGTAAEVGTLREHLRLNAQAARTFAEALGESDALAFVSSLLDYVERWTLAAVELPAMRPRVEGWVSLKKPARIDFSQLVRLEEIKPRRRDGFALTDRRFGEREVWFEVDHCIYCHDRDRDSCSKGMRHKSGELHVNPLGVTLTGCPLEEKISEAHVLKRAGDDIAALAVIMIDNPLVPGTGHRICNDCMKGCIYQKVEPVNIPQIETNILTSVLELPYGFEIYSLLTRWNPLNAARPFALPYNGRNVLVVGMGPAGYTLSHYLVNEGFSVTGIDALKIEPLPTELAGDDASLPEAIRDFSTIYEDLDKRVMTGFGGVAEYGITVRWDKNFLKVIYLCLARRRLFRLYGGVRFGGTLTIDDAWALGFDHIAIASGAGKPTIIELENNLIRGIRKASDFLMALQLTGAAKYSSMANLQVRLPAGVIGGGLTAIDTATELMAYYPVQVEKVLHRYELLAEVHGESRLRARFDAEELEILDEFLEHGAAVRAERARARDAGESPDFRPLVERWGGVTLFYRKEMSDSPAYRQNHEEVAKALEEGTRYAPCMNPVAARADERGHLRGV
ncbi:MAG: FAD-dependent oxidoreductase, partial [Gammaproteobacteria bacterium]|nr:FAD-dependent oxidoreductase [Gammaproteobacteria bacterium]